MVLQTYIVTVAGILAGVAGILTCAACFLAVAAGAHRSASALRCAASGGAAWLAGLVCAVASRLVLLVLLCLLDVERLGARLLCLHGCNLQSSGCHLLVIQVSELVLHSLSRNILDVCPGDVDVAAEVEQDYLLLYL